MVIVATAGGRAGAIPAAGMPWIAGGRGADAEEAASGDVLRRGVQQTHRYNSKALYFECTTLFRGKSKHCRAYIRLKTCKVGDPTSM